MDPISIAMLLGKIGAGIGKAKAVTGAASAAGGSGGLGSLLKGLAGKSMMAGGQGLAGGGQLRGPVSGMGSADGGASSMFAKSLSGLLSQQQPQQQMQPMMLQNIPDAGSGMAYEQTPMVQGFGGRY